MSTTMRMRNIQTGDFDAVRALGLKTWLRTYRKIYSEKRIRKDVQGYYTDERLAYDLRATKKGTGCFFIAERDGKILGYVQMGRQKRRWELFRIYVDPAAQRRGVGSALIKRIETFLRRKHARGYVAYPHARNPIACNFYEQKGFVRDHRLDRSRTDICYRKQL